ncbi:MAG: histidine kinase [Rhodobacteraceae bacterium]|nr:histidine kinase [Paracoccaceae bacterium]
MNGKWVGMTVLACAAAAGAGLYYLQVFGFYDRVSEAPGQEVLLTPTSGDPVALTVSGFEAIDADSSPIRFRACFSTEASADDLAGFTRIDGAEPRNAPFWFDCFDAPALGAAIKSGDVTVYLGTKNHAFGVDRLVAIGPDGRGWVWHELNECGKKAYDGTVVGEACPDR